MTRLPLSISIISQNEEANLRRCLVSAAELAQEIVIVDSGSTDRTAEIAAEFGVKFVHQDWLGYTAQKNHCLTLCSQPWILALDCDEVLTPELRESIQRFFANGDDQKFDGAWMSRLVATGIPTAKCASSAATKAAGPPMAAGRCMSDSMSMDPAPR
jgi:glycosyltransferase involved in cell wall biosynthesis